MKNRDYGIHCIGNVIRILDNRTILITNPCCSLEVGDTIQIYELGPEIKDLDGNLLCNYEFIKDELQVMETNEYYCKCQKVKTRSITKPSPLTQLSLSPLLGTSTTEYIPLNIDNADIEELIPTDPLVRIGDPVKLA